MKITTEMYLSDQAEPEKKHKVTMIIEDNLIKILPEGYSLEDNYPIALEFYEGYPRLIVWGKVDSDAPTNIIEIKRDRAER